MRASLRNAPGITAVQFTLLEICDPCIWVKDNNSLVVTDFYNEQSRSIYRFEGNGSPLRGRISLGSIKIEGIGTPSRKDIPKSFDGYSARSHSVLRSFIITA